MFIDNWKPLRKPKAYFTQGYAQQDLNHARRDYDSLIANVDAEFGRLMDILDATGLRDNTYVILTSDHGELFERGIQGHTTQAMYQPIIQIPMIIYPPGQKERKDVFVNTSCVDLLPTLLHLAGIAVPDRCEGQILPPFRDSEMPDERSLFTMDAKTTPKLAPFKKASFVVIRGSYKLIHNMGYGRDVPLYEMYNLMEDPDELENRSSIDKGITQEYMDILQEKIKLANQRV
jgi:arylsulfatase A-like enzyme